MRLAFVDLGPRDSHRGEVHVAKPRFDYVEKNILTAVVHAVYFFASQINTNFSLRKTKERLPVVCGGIDFDAQNKFLA
jgi:hypothetical protein